MYRALAGNFNGLKKFDKTLKSSVNSNSMFKRYKGKKRSRKGNNVLTVKQDSLVHYKDPELRPGGAWPSVLNHGFPAQPPYPGCKDPELRVHSDTFLQYNDAEGHRYSVSFENYHWRTGNTLNLEEIKEFDGHVRRLDFSFYPYQVAFIKNQYYPDFCPGVNLADVHKNGKEYNIELLKACYQLLYSIATCKNLLVFAPSGVTAGLGASMTFFAPLRGSSETTDVSFPQISYGYFPDCGATWFLPKLKGAIGMYLALTAKHLHKSDVFWSGFSTMVFENELMNTVDDVMSHYSRKRGNIGQTARAIQTVAIGPNVSTINNYLDEINRCFGEHHTTLQSVFDALENEGTSWSRKILERLESYSPVGLHVTFRLQRMGKYMKTIEEAFQMEYQVALKFLESHDYWEGITARVIENREPKWSYKNISEVPQDEISSYFERQTDENLTLKSSHIGSKFNTDIRWFEGAIKDGRKQLIYEAEPDLGYDLDQAIDDIDSLDNRSLGEMLNFYKNLIYEKDLHKVAAGFTGFNYPIINDPVMKPDTAMTQKDKNILMEITRGERADLGINDIDLPPERNELQECLDQLKISNFNEINSHFSIWDCPYERPEPEASPTTDFYENEGGETRLSDVGSNDFDKAIEAALHLLGHEQKNPVLFRDESEYQTETSQKSVFHKTPEEQDPWDIVLFDEYTAVIDERLAQAQSSVESEV